jgi:hypothetical protein
MSNNPIWPIGPLHNAADVPLSSNPGTLPNVADDVMHWFQLLVFEHVTKTIVNFQVVETTTPVNFFGFVATEPKRVLRMQPNGQRAWKVKIVWTVPTVILSPDDVVIYESTQYRIGATIDYKQYGIVGYEMLQDYTGSDPIIP